MSKASAASVKADESGKKPAGVLAFYSQKEHTGPKLELWINTNEKEGAPEFDGTFGENRVSAYFRQGPKGNFLALFNSAKRDDGSHEQIGTAQVVSNVAGIPKLAMNINKRTMWAEVSKKVPQDMLVECGLDLGKQAAKKKAYVAQKASQAAPKADE